MQSHSVADAIPTRVESVGPHSSGSIDDAPVPQLHRPFKVVWEAVRAADGSRTVRLRSSLAVRNNTKVPLSVRVVSHYYRHELSFASIARHAADPHADADTVSAECSLLVGRDYIDLGPALEGQTIYVPLLMSQCAASILVRPSLPGYAWSDILPISSSTPSPAHSGDSLGSGDSSDIEVISCGSDEQSLHTESTPTLSFCVHRESSAETLILSLCAPLLVCNRLPCVLNFRLCVVAGSAYSVLDNGFVEPGDQYKATRTAVDVARIALQLSVGLFDFCCPIMVASERESSCDLGHPLLCDAGADGSEAGSAFVSLSYSVRIDPNSGARQIQVFRYLQNK